MMSAAILAYSGVPVRNFIFPLVFVQMQLLEGLRWMNAVDERILAILGKIAIYLQPAAALYEGKQYGWILPYLVVQTIVEVVFGSRDLRFKVSDDGHFQWAWIQTNWIPTTFPYWIALAVATYILLPFPMFALMCGLLAYYNYAHGQYHTSGSLWCVSVNVLWIYYLLRDIV